jgi:hypothetical protein
MAQSVWTLEVVSILEDFVAQRNSASVIADEFIARFKKKFTRSSVLGKIHRMKMGKKKAPTVVQKRSHHKMVRSNIISHNVVELFQPPEIDIRKTPPLNLYIGQLDNGDTKPFGRCEMCRYPSQDASGLTIYCGLPTGGKSSWCSYHRKMLTVVARAR